MKSLLLKRAAFVTAMMLLNVLNTSAQVSEPEIVINYIPKTGEAGIAEGRVVWNELTAGNAGQYAVIAMLRAPWGDDYVKPTNTNYLNIIDVSGSFYIDITTGGSGDYAIEEVSFFFVRRSTFTDIDGSTVKYHTMSGKYLGQPVTINRTSFKSSDLHSPVPDVLPGFIEAGRNITLSCQPGETIHFTVDGSDPQTSSSSGTYTTSTSLRVPANGSLLVKAVTTRSGVYSPVVSLLWLPKESLTTPFWGLSTSLALNDENFGYSLSKEMARTRLEPVAKLTKWIRTYGTLNNGLSYINQIAKSEFNLRTMIGVHITNDATENNAQIQGLRQILDAGPAPDLIAVGNECSLSGVHPEVLAANIDVVREVLKSKSLVIPVGSVDVAGAPWSMSVLSKLDFVGCNIFTGTWDATPQNQMLAQMKQSYANEVAKYQPKMVILTETGTPYSGGSYVVNGATLSPSTSKANSYLSGFLEWIQRENIPSFYFEAYDEPVKSQNGGHQIEQFFGIMDGNLQIHTFYQETIGKYIDDTSIQSLDKSEINPYPNPVKDAFTLTGLMSETAIVEICDLSGKVVKIQDFSQNNETINISNLPDGIYFVKVGTSVCKIIKKQ